MRLDDLYDPAGGGRPPLPIGDRILPHIEITETGCWIWQRSRDRDGYGKMTVGGGPHRHQRVHRVVWMWLVGDLPDELTIDHLCRVRACCNPDHLEPVSVAVNILRGEGPAALNARKTHCQHGHPLNASNVRVETGGLRRCRACQFAYQRSWWAARGTGA